MEKLSKLITLWTSKNKFFSEETLDQMKNPGNSLTKYKADLAEKFRSVVEEVIIMHAGDKCHNPILQVERQISSTYSNYKQQHEQFVNHASSNIDSQQTQLDSLQQQIKELRPVASSQQPASGGRKSRWDRTSAVSSSAAPPQPGVAPPGLPMVDLSRPPPGFGLGPAEPERPSAPYYDLPAGLMVPLVSDVPCSSTLFMTVLPQVKLEDSGYKPLDPDLIRLPPPQPPNDRLMAAVELFYSGPSHERPR